jgi:hypothetical protein
MKTGSRGGRRATEHHLELRLWPGEAPGSQGWTQAEEVLHLGGEDRVRNVVVPTLTAFAPAGSHAAAVIAPGGASTCSPGRTKGSVSPTGSPVGA